MYSEYSGGPQSTRDQLVQIAAPRGGTMTDGLRLAILNGLGLILAALVIGIVSVFLRLLDLPHVLIGFIVGVAFVALGVFVWFRYAEAHGRAARARQRRVQPDIYGAIAGLPFARVGLALVSSGLFGLFLGMVTFSMSRATDGFERLLFALIFAGLAAANIIIARAASD